MRVKALLPHSHALYTLGYLAGFSAGLVFGRFRVLGSCTIDHFLDGLNTLGTISF